MDSCKTCAFFLGWANGVDGECRWKPPPAVRAKDWNPFNARTTKDGSCSQHKSK